MPDAAVTPDAQPTVRSTSSRTPTFPSSDSRANGTIPIDKVIGRAFVVVWPLRRVKPLPVPDPFR